MIFKEISDDYLITLFYEKNQDAIDFLIDKYTKVIYGIIKDIQQRVDDYVDFNDMFQEGFLVFWGCLERYDQDSGSFYFFVRKSIERKLMDKIMCMKRYVNYLPINEIVYEDGNEQMVDYIADKEDCYFENCSYENLVSRIDDVSKSIVDLKMDGYSYQEIAKILNLTKQSIYRRVGKIKNILKDVIEKID